MTTGKVEISHWSDVLCVWAYVGQIRMDELCDELGDRVEVSWHFVNVFGSVHRKIDKGWASRGGFGAYGAHVRSVAARFDHVTIHPEIWTRNIPASSLSCHLFLRAAALAEATSGKESPFERLTWALRRAFFVDLADVSQLEVQLALAEAHGFDVSAIEAALRSGEAHAALDADLLKARANDVAMSPCIVLDGGRQTLKGNVGYRVIAANVRELLEGRREDHQSWC